MSTERSILLSSMMELETNESQYSVFYHAYNLNKLENLSNNYSNNSNWTTGDFESLLTSGDLSWTDLLKFSLQGVGICVIAFLGVIGNILSVIVLSHKRMRSSISCLLIGLALCDIIILVNSTLVLGLPTVIQYTASQKDTTDTNSSSDSFLRFGHLVPIVIGVAATAVTGSVFFTVAVTIERYLFVCQPFLARRICTWQRSIQCSVAIIIFAALFNLSRWWEFNCITVYEADKTTVAGCRPTPSALRTNPHYDLYYVHISYLIIQVLGPLICIIFVNTLIYLRIKKANANRKNLSTSESKENSLTYMLFLVVTVFVISNLLPMFIMITNLIKPQTLRTPELEIIGLFLINLNSSLNFAIYCLVGEKFRDIFLDIFCPCRIFMCQKRARHGSDLSNNNHSLSSGMSSSQKSKPNFKASVRTICEDV